MNTNELILNPLPSLTWFRLGVNETRLQLGEYSTRQASMAVSGPSDILIYEENAVEEGLDKEDISSDRRAYFRIPKETYVAGKSPIRADGIFPTGLGLQFQELMGREKVQVIEIPENMKSEEVLFLSIFHDGCSDAKLRLLIRAGEGSDTKVILCSRGNSCSQSRKELVSVQIILEKGARLELNRVNLLDTDIILLDDMGVHEAEEAHFTYRKADLGAAKSFGGCSVFAAGDRSGAEIDTAYLKTSAQMLDLNYHVVHAGKESASRIDMKGVLGGTAVKTFRGTIDFRKGCRGADGAENEEVCLLDESVVNKTVPVILCEEEDVNGRHGASVGRIDENELFYCESRGIDEEAARHLLVRGRLMSVIQKIPDAGLQREIGERIRDVLSESYRMVRKTEEGGDRV